MCRSAQNSFAFQNEKAWKKWCMMMSKKSEWKLKIFNNNKKSKWEEKKSAHKSEYTQKRSKISFRHLQQKKWEFYLKSLCTQHKIQLQKHDFEVKEKKWIELNTVTIEKETTLYEKIEIPIERTLFSLCFLVCIVKKQSDFVCRRCEYMRIFSKAICLCISLICCTNNIASIIFTIFHIAIQFRFHLVIKKTTMVIVNHLHFQWNWFLFFSISAIS